jgi:hypothetical protein
MDTALHPQPLTRREDAVARGGSNGHGCGGELRAEEGICGITRRERRLVGPRGQGNLHSHPLRRVPFYPSFKVEFSMGKGCCFCVWVVEPSPCTHGLSTGASMRVLFWLLLFICFG